MITSLATTAPTQFPRGHRPPAAVTPSPGRSAPTHPGIQRSVRCFFPHLARAGLQVWWHLLSTPRDYAVGGRSALRAPVNPKRTRS
jgi:hypothetical protein